MRLMIGGKEFDLKPLTLNDWVEAEEMGIDFSRLQKAVFKLKDLRTLCYVALKKVDPSVTVEWVGDNISLTDSALFDQIVNFITPKGVEAKVSA